MTGPRDPELRQSLEQSRTLPREQRLQEHKQLLQELLEKLPSMKMLRKAVQLRERGKLTEKIWKIELKEPGKDEIDEEWEDTIWTHYYLSTPKNLETYLNFILVALYYHEHEEMSVRQIADLTGLSESKIQRLLSEPEAKPTIKDASQFHRGSGKTIKRWIR